MFTTAPIGSASQLTIGNPAISTVAASDTLTRQPLGNNDNEISDADAPSSSWDPEDEYRALPPPDNTAGDWMDLIDKANHGSDTTVVGDPQSFEASPAQPEESSPETDTIEVEVRQSPEAPPTQSDASTHESDESDDAIRDPPDSEFQPSSEDEPLPLSHTTRQAGTATEDNDSDSTIENPQPSSEASPTQAEASTDEAHREDDWTGEEEEKLVELLRAQQSGRVRKIGLSLTCLSNLELFEEVSKQLKECGITRSTLACDEW
jgi:hypothetical protein